MNEKTNHIIGYVLCFVLGAIITGGTTFYFAERESTRAIDDIRSTNQRLENELATSRGFISECQRIVGSAESTTAKLRAIIQAMPD